MCGFNLKVNQPERKEIPVNIIIISLLVLSLVGAYVWERAKSRMANGWRRLSAADEALLAYACPDPLADFAHREGS